MTKLHTNESEPINTVIEMKDAESLYDKVLSEIKDLKKLGPDLENDVDFAVLNVLLHGLVFLFKQIQEINKRLKVLERD